MQLPFTLPDEILFSRLVRHLTISGMQNDDYLKWILGNSRASVHPYLTANIERIADLFGESKTTLFREQTLTPLFTYFLPKYSEKISAAMLSRGSNLIRLCQLASFKESEQLSLKYCPQCAKQDIHEYGVSYWHRNHQIPGIEACPKHRVWFIHTSLPERIRLHSGFIPPSETETTSCSESSANLANYAVNQLALICEGSPSFNPMCYTARLTSKGYITKGKRLRRQHLSKDFYDFVRLLDYSSDELLPESSEDYKYLSYLLSGGISQHPFKHLLFGYWLTTDLSNSRCGSDYSEPALRVSHLKLIESQCTTLLQDGLSMAEVSRRTGKSRCYLKALALRENIPINLKPKTITPRLQERIIALARKGFHRQTIANLFDISIGSVELQISTQPKLVERRKQCKHESKRRRYKAHVIRYCRTCPDAIRRDVKQYCNAAFYWLYSHERQWLELVLPKPTKPTAKPRVDWVKRDAELVEKVQELMKKNDFHLSRTELDRLLGGHGWLTSKKIKLPNTIKAYHSLFRGKPDV